MLADFCIRRVSNDMKISIQKNHLRGQILYRSPNPVKKRRHILKNKIIFPLPNTEVSIPSGARTIKA